MISLAAGPRVRQVVLMSADLAATTRELRTALGLGAPFSDPALAGFGLRNEVYALGDQFLEVCEPISPGSAGQRHLDRLGDSGYQVAFQVPDIAAARARVARLGIRIVWEGGTDGIAGVHLHPKDLPGAIVSMDMATPPESWAWGGPEWTGRAGYGAPGEIVGLTISVDDPQAVATAWARALGRVADGAAVAVGDQRIDFVADADRGPRGLIGIEIRRQGPESDVEVCGVRLALRRARPPGAPAGASGR